MPKNNCNKGDNNLSLKNSFENAKDDDDEMKLCLKDLSNASELSEVSSKIINQEGKRKFRSNVRQN